MSTTRTVLCRDALAENFIDEGFVAGKPRHVSHDTVRLDAEVAASTPCEECGSPAGLDVMPFRSRDGKVYRLLAWCAVCEAATEL